MSFLWRLRDGTSGRGDAFSYETWEGHDGLPCFKWVGGGFEFIFVCACALAHGRPAMAARRCGHTSLNLSLFFSSDPSIPPPLPPGAASAARCCGRTSLEFLRFFFPLPPDLFLPFSLRRIHGCPALRAHLADVARFWLADVGIDGWRLDVAHEVSPS